MTLPCAALSVADITQMNTVRKHLSAIKGGRLAAACHPAGVVTLAISDVPGDEMSVIASDPHPTPDRHAPTKPGGGGRSGLSAAEHLSRNDAYGYFAALGDLVITGPTHTNVNDFRALLVL